MNCEIKGFFDANERVLELTGWSPSQTDQSPSVNLIFKFKPGFARGIV